MMDIVVCVLGRQRLLPDPQTPPFPAKAYQLLAILSRSHGQRAARRTIAGLVWSQASEAAALANLRQLLVRIRRSGIDERLLCIDAEAIWLAADPAIDVCIFLRLVASDRLETLLEGLALFGGDLLEGAGDISEALEDWLVQERAALREAYFAACSRALIELTRFGAAPPQTLGEIEQNLLRVEPDREASYRALIEAYGRNGLYAEARRLYRTLAKVLAREHGAQISSETTAVLRRMLAAEPVSELPVAQEVKANQLAFLPVRFAVPAQAAPIVSILIEDVAHGLSRYRSLQVLAPHSSFQLGEDDGRSAERLEAFGVDYVVAGFVTPDAESLALRLVRRRDHTIVWAAEYPVAAEELATTFRQLSLLIASSLADAIERERAAPRPPLAEAYHNYLKGREQLRQIDLAGVRRARGAFRQALRLQPAYGAAHARVAQTLYLEWLLLGGTDPQLLSAAQLEASSAIAADQGDGDGHWVRGVVALYQRDFDGATEHFGLAERLNPNSADLLVQHADALGHMNVTGEAWTKFERALTLNPLPPDHYWWAGAGIAFVDGDYERAIALCARMSSDMSAIRLLAAAHALKGDLREARRYGRKVRETYPGSNGDLIARLAPNKDQAITQRFIEGLRLAGLN